MHKHDIWYVSSHLVIITHWITPTKPHSKKTARWISWPFSECKGKDASTRWIVSRLLNISRYSNERENECFCLPTNSLESVNQQSELAENNSIYFHALSAWTWMEWLFESFMTLSLIHCRSRCVPSTPTEYWRTWLFLSTRLRDDRRDPTIRSHGSAMCHAQCASFVSHHRTRNNDRLRSFQVPISLISSSSCTE